MGKLLVEIDDEVHKALWELEEQKMAEAYARQPDSAEAYFESKTWDPDPLAPKRLVKSAAA